ncbi:MAG: hypothetical protein D6E12_02100 [Desulfovibrio sp.]|nr:MAG: hypothetical protein D6E12_02100 [Desulfovibrio sp.]
MHRLTFIPTLLILLVLLPACRGAAQPAPDYQLPSCAVVDDDNGLEAELCLDYGLMSCTSDPAAVAQGLLVTENCRLQEHTTVVTVEPGAAFGLYFGSNAPITVSVEMVVQAPDLDFAPDRVHTFTDFQVFRSHSVARILAPSDGVGRTRFHISVNGQLLSTITFLLQDANPVTPENAEDQ